MSSIGVAWRQARAARPLARRVPLTVRFVTWTARRLPSWPRMRTAVMQTGGFAAIDYGLFGWSHLAGYIAVGISLLVLEALSGDR